ncbi:hypothetical protein [Rhizobium leucaenae]|uniref:hypothetical protein n=1 Tax=Rhizobium leucaenae TaxID=29450 RepID=UPI00048C1FE5|nr:hypothetical protein [Rhizobium leucaenae]
MTNHQFYVGQQVVCISAAQPANTTLPSELTEGAIYKIRWIGEHTHYLDRTYIGVRLEGIDRGTCQIWGDVDTPFRATRFRPLVADRLGSLRALLVPGQPLAPSVEGPLRPVKVKEEERV